MDYEGTVYMIQFVTESGKIVTLKSDRPWPLSEPERRYLDAEMAFSIVQRVCICNDVENYNKDIRCPAHGQQHPKEKCPKCQINVLGYCPQGEYCTAEYCDYVM